MILHGPRSPSQSYSLFQIHYFWITVIHLLLCKFIPHIEISFTPKNIQFEKLKKKQTYILGITHCICSIAEIIASDMLKCAFSLSNSALDLAN